MPLAYAFQNLEITGGLGDDADFQSPATEVHWKWYYSFPTLPLWIVLLVITFLPKRNRQEQIWPILITPFIAELVYQLLSWNITAKEASGIDAMVYLLVGLAMTWSAVWILAPWLSRGGRFVVSIKQFILLLLLGVVALGGYYGFSLPKEIFSGSEKNNILFISGLIWAVASLSLVGNGFLIGLRRSSEKPFRPLLRILFVLPVVAFGGLCLFGLIICLLNEGFTIDALTAFPGFLAVSSPAALILASFIYLLNLPVCLSGRRWPTIKERWLASFPMKK